MYNLTRYKVNDRIVVGKDEDGYPHQEVTILEKAPKMMKVQTIDGSYWGKAQIRWLSADEWFVIVKLKTMEVSQ